MKTIIFVWIIMPLVFLSQGKISEAFELNNPLTPEQSRNSIDRFRAASAIIELTVKDRNGNASRYAMRMIRAGEGDGRRKKLITIQYPEHVKGTALLIYSRNDGPSDLWFYLSARRRVKRIHPCFHASRFLNIPWSYEDLAGHMFEKYTWRRCPDDTNGGKIFSVFEAIPKTNSGYLRLLWRIDRETGLVHEIAYYDRRNELHKTLTLHRYEQYADNQFYIREMSMVNHKSGKQAHARFSRYRFNPGFDPNCLSEKYLRKTGGTQFVLSPAHEKLPLVPPGTESAGPESGISRVENPVLVASPLTRAKPSQTKSP